VDGSQAAGFGEHAVSAHTGSVERRRRRRSFTGDLEGDETAPVYTGP
jgi:hypothetical protein